MSEEDRSSFLLFCQQPAALAWLDDPAQSPEAGRLRQAVDALLAAGYRLTVVYAAAEEAAADALSPREGLRVCQVPSSFFEHPERLDQVLHQAQPDAIGGIGLLPAVVAAQVVALRPLWVDLSASTTDWLAAAPTAEVDAAGCYRWWAGLGWLFDRADKLSVGSATARGELLTHLGLRGRLHLGDGGFERVEVWEGEPPPGLGQWWCQPIRDPRYARILSAEEQGLRQTLAAQQQELTAIHQSRFYRSWQKWGQLRRGLGRALAIFLGLLRRPLVLLGLCGTLVAATLRPAGRLGLWLWLWFDTTSTRVAAALRRFLGTPAAVALPPPVVDRQRRPRLLIVMPYRIYPPNHGGAVRLYNLIRLLAEDADIHLLIFDREPGDEQRSALEALGVVVHQHHWEPSFEHPWWTLEPPNSRLFGSHRVAEKIRDLVYCQGIEVLHLENTELASYRRVVPEVAVLLVEEDVTFRSFRRRRSLGFHRRYPDSRAFGASHGDWMRMLRHEVRSCRQVDQVHAMSADDGAYLASFLGDGGRRIVVVPNAVDCAFYRPPQPPLERNGILIVGNYQNLPNVDAVTWFMAEVWPLVRQGNGSAELTLVGAEMPEEVRAHGRREGVAALGAVPELRPFYHRHRVLAVPIRAGSGTRLKLFEAFAAEIPAVSTTLGAEGIDCSADEHLLIADAAPAFAAAILRLLDDRELGAKLAGAASRWVKERHDWRHSAAVHLAALHQLLPEQPPPAPAVEIARFAAESAAASDRVDISIVYPTLNGGELFERSLQAITEQQCPRSWEVICVDSGSSAADLETMRRHGVRIQPIDRSTFNHGLTRDRGAALARGEVIVFLNQDAVPADQNWLDGLTAPLFAEDPPAAVQGGIREFEQGSGVARFFWDSCGQRFYFTRESEGWIERFAGVGFSTVNAALRTEVWRQLPFGYAEIMEDKKWQRRATEAGLRIDSAHQAAVLHTHDYDLRSLVRRCYSEGFGWRLLGESYSAKDLAHDLLIGRVWLELAKGLLRGRAWRPAALLFPMLRPVALWWGNHFGRQVLH